MSTTIDGYISKAPLLKNKVDILLNKDILLVMLPVQMTVRRDNVIAHLQIWRTVLPEKLSVARRDYFAQGALKYSTNEWIKVGLLLDEIEMTRKWPPSAYLYSIPTHTYSRRGKGWGRGRL